MLKWMTIADIPSWFVTSHLCQLRNGKWVTASGLWQFSATLKVTVLQWSCVTDAVVYPPVG